MTTSVSIQLESRTVLAIPSSAVRREGGRHFVLVSVNGRPELREVRLGWKDGAWTEVADGLAAGQRILLDRPDPRKRKEMNRTIRLFRQAIDALSVEPAAIVSDDARSHHRHRGP